MKKLRITVEEKVYEVTVEVLDEGAATTAPQPPQLAAPVAATPSAPAPAPAPVAAPAAPGDVVSPLAGSVTSIDVQPGQSVSEGQGVLVLEAMKMNTTVVASSAGTVKSIAVETGASVQEGQVLMSLG
ncbi:MAG: biotin/lipoyl-containing protein [Alphaproteobacteria bacterium]|jgi:biotin carboxyl carrier protein|nr:biotin/lipoyl-containing protein [Alphaproteobacteria bacterium]|tara:strand:+ start:1599 stop:1982 length:384 start_codon:yes stop_codon:yes gene_type:complete